jgi:hypothetical protein
MRKTQVLVGILLICAGAVLQGCSTNKVGAEAAGTASYAWVSLESIEPVSIEKVYVATLKAVDELKLPVIQKGVDSMSGKIIARDVEDKKIVVTLNATTDGMTKLSIRVGTIGDEAKSKLLYEQIKKNL